MPAFAGSRMPITTNSSMSGGSSGANAVNLRNLGVNRTLVLLDGQRSVGINADGTVDINLFPQNLVTRVDVVTGGASAAYGSDALAGVVNFVLDKKFTGVKGEASGGVTTYGDHRSWDINMAAGTGFANGRGHFLVSGQAGSVDGIPINNRPWNLQGWEFLTNPAYTATNGQPQRILRNQVSVDNGIAGGIITAGPLKGIAFGPGGVPYQFVYGSIVSDPAMSGGQWAASTIRGTRLANGLVSSEVTQNAFTRLSYQITDTIEIYAQASWAHNFNHNWCCAREDNASITIKADNAFIPASVAAQMAALKVTTLTMGTMNQDLNTQGASNDRIIKRYVVGANGSFDAMETAWTWDFYYQAGQAQSHQEATGVVFRPNYNSAVDAVRNTQGQIVCRAQLANSMPGCVPYNIFGIGVNSQAAINYAHGLGAKDFRTERFSQDVIAASITGEPFSSWAGPVSVATGIEHRREKVTGINDPLAATGGWAVGNYLIFTAANSVTEGFVETVVPLAKDTVWAKSLDLNAAIRATDYKTSGYVTTWKVGATYDPIDDIRFRVTKSHDIRAPNLQELFSAGGGGFPGVINPFRNGASEITVSSTRGNPNLVPEVSDMTGVGVVLNPQFFPGFNASVDYWNLDIDKSIGTLTVQQIIDNCYSGNQQLCQAITFGAGNLITLINLQPFNLVKQIARGIDFEASYRTPLDAINADWSGNVTLRFLATRFIKNYSSNGINLPTDTAGQNTGGGPPRWRWNGSLNYASEAFSMTFGARGVSAGVYNNTNIECTSGCPASTVDRRTVDTNHIDGAVFFDTSISYKLAVGDSSTTELFLNVRNITNKDPAIVAPGPGGFTYEAPPANPSLYDVLGRTFRAGIRFKL